MGFHKICTSNSGIEHHTEYANHKKMFVGFTYEWIKDSYPYSFTILSLVTTHEKTGYRIDFA